MAAQTTKTDWADTVRSIEAALKATASPERAEYEKKYHKSDLRFIGCSVPDVHRQVKEFARENKAISRKELFDLAKRLWATECHEMRSVAVGLLVRFSDLVGINDLALFRRWILDTKGWALVDWISTGILGSVYSRFPESEATLKAWSRDKSFWVRRAGMLALLNEAKHGNEKAFQLFAEMASQMLDEKEFFIRKAIGWFLREVSKKRRQVVFEFLMEHVDQISGLTFREGAKYLSEDHKLQLTAARAEECEMGDP